MTATSPKAGVVALRTIGSLLVELPFTVERGLYPWAASLWPAPGRPPGWGRELWTYDPVRRGWIIPTGCTHGTVIELGAAHPPHRRRRSTPAHTAWYSVALAHDQHWLVCSAPFTNPANAHHHARSLTDQYRQAAIERYSGGAHQETRP